MTFEIIDYVMFHNLQIPPGPPLQSGVTVESQAKLIPHFSKGGPGGILNVMNYVKLNR
jgi:hypothetical protein